MGFFFRNPISGNEHEERKRKGKGHNGPGKRQKKRYSSSSSHLDRVPDEILVHILSLMPTKDCVQSSILGKRWRLLWARVPNLKFHGGDRKKTTLRSFIDFFNRFVFVHKGHTINSFSIEYYDPKDTEYKLEIERLIATAIACNVQVIKIRYRCDLVLPQGLFTSKTLGDLTLDCFGCKCVGGPTVPIPMIGTSSVVFLPALKKLQLDVTLWYESEESVARLLYGCPVLEELTVHKENDDVFRFHVSSPTLTRLHLDMCNHNDSGEYREVKLDTPALKYLWLQDDLSRDFSAGMLASLTEADVDFSLSDVLDPSSVLEFVGKLNNVSCLKLRISEKVPHSAWTDSTLTSTEFRNLTKLVLDGAWRFLTTFLQNSENLQALIVDMDHMDQDDEPQYWMEPKQVPVCLISHLQTVRVDYFKCSDPEFDMVKYVLKNAKVLTMMKIRVSGDDLKEKKEALERITLFERASEACELAFD